MQRHGRLVGSRSNQDYRSCRKPISGNYAHWVLLLSRRYEGFLWNELGLESRLSRIPENESVVRLRTISVGYQLTQTRSP